MLRLQAKFRVNQTNTAMGMNIAYVGSNVPDLYSDECVAE